MPSGDLLTCPWTSRTQSSSSDSESDDSDSDKPLAARRKSKSPGASGAKRKRATTPKKESSAKRSKKEPGSSKSGQVMWKTLKHAGVLFPPEYEVSMPGKQAWHEHAGQRPTPVKQTYGLGYHTVPIWYR